MEIIQEGVSSQMVNKAMSSMMTNQPDLMFEFVELNKSVFDGTDPGAEIKLPDTFTQAMSDEVDMLMDTTSPVELDMMYYEEAVNILKEDPKEDHEHITFEPTLAMKGQPMRCVVLSEKGAIALNQGNQQIWFDNNDAIMQKIKDKAETDDYLDPPYALYTDKYRVPKAGTSPLRPEMETRTFPKKIVWFSQLGRIYTFCEKVRSGDSGFGAFTGGTTSNATLDPKKYGVRFNPDIGSCNYTKAYCDKMVLQYRGDIPGGDCEPASGQDAWEALLGKTYTRFIYDTLGINDSKAAQVIVGSIGNAGATVVEHTVGAAVGIAWDTGEGAVSGARGIVEAISGQSKWKCKPADEQKTCMGWKSLLDGKCYKSMWATRKASCPRRDKFDNIQEGDGFCTYRGKCHEYTTPCLVYKRC